MCGTNDGQGRSGRPARAGTQMRSNVIKGFYNKKLSILILNIEIPRCWSCVTRLPVLHPRYVYFAYKGVGQARALTLTGRVSGEGPLREANGRAGARMDAG